METTKPRITRLQQLIERTAEELYEAKQTEMKVKRRVPFSELTEGGKEAWRRRAREEVRAR